MKKLMYLLLMGLLLGVPVKAGDLSYLLDYIPDLVAWYDANDLSAPLNDGDVVTVWPNKVPGTRSDGETTGDSITYLETGGMNGHPGVLQSGVRDALFFPYLTDDFLDGRPWTIFIVTYSTYGSSGDYGGIASPGIPRLQLRSNTITIGEPSVALPLVAGQGLRIARLDGTLDGSGTLLGYVNDSYQGSVDTTATGGLIASYGGSHTGLGFPHYAGRAGGRLSEMLIFNRALSFVELNAVAYYLTQKYDIDAPGWEDPLPTKTLTVATNITEAESRVTPGVGANPRFENQTVTLNAEPVFSVLPNVYEFSSWTGDVDDPASPQTTVLMDADKTVTANYISSSIPLVSITIGTEPAGLDFITPAAGVYQLAEGEKINFSADVLEHVDCPNVWRFSSWLGNVENPTKAAASMIVSAPAPATMVFLHETFDSPWDKSAWVRDRRLPSAFDAESFDGDWRLKVSIDGDAKTKYEILEGDFHIHTTHSDGILTPQERVIEAWEWGFDVIAITDHGNFGAYEHALPTAQALGLVLIRGMETGLAEDGTLREHLVALDFSADYIRRNEHRWDVNEGQDYVFYQEQWGRITDAGGYVLYAHPDHGLKPELMWAVEQGLLRGVELKNDVVGSGRGTVESHGTYWYPFAFEWALKHNLAVFANSDVHGLRSSERNTARTLVLAEERTVDGVMDAIRKGRTIAHFNGMYCAREELLTLLVRIQVKVHYTRLSETESLLQLENTGPMDLTIEINGASSVPVHLAPYQKVAVNILSPPGAPPRTWDIGPMDAIKLRWTNLWISPDDNLTTTHYNDDNDWEGIARYLHYPVNTVQTVSADLYVGSDWATEERAVRLWTPVVDTDGITYWLMVSYREPEDPEEGGTGFYKWFDGQWHHLMDVTTFGQWYNLKVRLTRNVGFEWLINGNVVSTDAALLPVSHRFGRVILSAFNFGEDYDVYWDNVKVTGSTVQSDFDTVIAVYEDARECGDECHPIQPFDVNEDCRIDMMDFAALALEWLVSTHPDDDEPYSYEP